MNEQSEHERVRVSIDRLNRVEQRLGKTTLGEHDREKLREALSRLEDQLEKVLSVASW